VKEGREDNEVKSEEYWEKSYGILFIVPSDSVTYSPSTVQLVKFAFPFVSTATRTPISFVRNFRQGMTSS
jgi:hypothetical protein